MIDSGKRTIGTSYGPFSVPQPFESLGRGDFVYEMTIDVDEGLTVCGVDEMVVVDFIVESAGG
jgi:hypothetical protein